MWVTKLLISEVKKRIFCPKTTKFGPKLAFFLASIWARPCRLIQCPVVGRLVVVAHGLYLARHLFTLFGHQERAVLLLQLRPLQRGLFGENRSLHSSQSRPSSPSNCQHPMTPHDHFVHSRRTTTIFKNNIATLSRLRLNSQLDWSNCVSRKTRS